jgi:hypothetical protein
MISTSASEPSARRQALDPRPRGELVDRGRAGPDEGRRALAGHPPVVVDEAHQAECKPAAEQGRELQHAAPVVVLDRRLDRLDAVREHVPEQEQEDAGRERRQGRAHLRRGAAVAAERQAEEDREPGDRAEDERLRRAHVRQTLQTS